MEKIFRNLIKCPEQASFASKEELFTTWGMIRTVWSLRSAGIEINDEKFDRIESIISAEITKRTGYTTIGLPAYYSLDTIIDRDKKPKKMWDTPAKPITPTEDKKRDWGTPDVPITPTRDTVNNNDV